MKKELSIRDIDRIIEMAWEDRTPFDAIVLQFGIKEQEVIDLMRKEMKPSSFRMWRKRVQGRKTKHLKKRAFEEGRFKCSRQRQITHNKISKR
ncbi:TIGR03643 family protein [Aquimarina pacifica]|uniref:TIGR03643 family protein n=1 Tax=Aquimarina pacifica TaxID=1296415 RepID=UPI000472B8DA|nr:TIGR03643 family protein [Aquimarina pacifica]